MKKLLLLQAKLIAYGADRVQSLAHSYVQSEVERSAGYEEFVNSVRNTVEMVDQKLSAPVRWLASLPTELVKTIKGATSNVSRDVERLHERLKKVSR